MVTTIMTPGIDDTAQLWYKLFPPTEIELTVQLYPKGYKGGKSPLLNHNLPPFLYTFRLLLTFL